MAFTFKNTTCILLELSPVKLFQLHSLKQNNNFQQDKNIIKVTCILITLRRYSSWTGKTKFISQHLKHLWLGFLSQQPV